MASNASTVSSKTTLAELATKLGLSRSTVSRSINGVYGPHRISEETRARVIRVAKELGYRPDWSARALATKRTQQIGVLYRHSVPEMRGIYREIFQGVTDTLEPLGYHMTFVRIRTEPDAEVFDPQRIDGCLLADHVPDELLSRIASTNVPAVLLNLTAGAKLHEVMPDDAQGTRLAMQHLFDLGHRRIAFVRHVRDQSIPHQSIQLREQVFAECAQEMGIAGACPIVRGPIETLCERIPVGADQTTAVFCYSHFEAVRMLAEYARRGLSCPRDYSLICFDDVEPMAHLHPRVTTIRVPAREIGTAGAKLLLAQLNNQITTEPRRIVLPVELMARESTAVPAGN
jgi:LacI family transcriptional regulator